MARQFLTLLTVSSLLLVTGAQTTRSCSSVQYECCADGNCIPVSWLCDGLDDCRHGDDENNCGFTPTDDTSSTTSTPDATDCKLPFEMVGGKCILFEPFAEITWMEARYLCQRFSADLVIIDSADFFMDLLQYIVINGLTNHDLWVGATDTVEEQEWRWINGELMYQGTPLWAIYGSGSSYSQEPRDDYGDQADCAYLDKERFFYMDDDNCDTMKGAICHISPWTLLNQHSPNATQENDASKQEIVQVMPTEQQQKQQQQHRGTAVKGTRNKKRRNPTHETVLKHKKIAPENKLKNQNEAPAESIPVQLTKDEMETVSETQDENHYDVHKVKDGHQHLLQWRAENQHP